MTDRIRMLYEIEAQVLEPQTLRFQFYLGDPTKDENSPADTWDGRGHAIQILDDFSQVVEIIWLPNGNAVTAFALAFDFLHLRGYQFDAGKLYDEIIYAWSHKDDAADC